MINKSCQNIVYSNKIYDCCRVVPYGPKYNIWFTKIQEKPILKIQKIISSKTHYSKRNTKQQIVNEPEYINIPNIVFHQSLSNETKCIGTIIQSKNKTNIICLENVLLFMGNKVDNTISWKQRYHMLLSIASKISKIQEYTYVKQFKQKQKYLFTLPITRIKDTEIHNFLNTKKHELIYKAYAIEYMSKCDSYYIKCFQNSKDIQQKHIKEKQATSQYKEYVIQADEKQDIYKLFDNTFLGYAHIPDFKTSVMMNSIFRDIKENSNLDALEESDDEYEFENVSANKFTDMNVMYTFKCSFNERFQLWQPIQIIR